MVDDVQRVELQGFVHVVDDVLTVSDVFTVDEVGGW